MVIWKTQPQADGGGIDVWLGSLNHHGQHKTLTGILCTFDTLKRDAEIKLLIGCTEEDIQIIQRFPQRNAYTLHPKPNGGNNMNFPEEFLDLLNEESKALLYLATLMPDGSPQVTPVWFDTDGEYILINTNEGRVKDRNMKARPNVAMTIQDPNDPYRYLGIRGEVVGYTREGADEHINSSHSNTITNPGRIAEGQRRIFSESNPLHFDLHN